MLALKGRDKKYRKYIQKSFISIIQVLNTSCCALSGLGFVRDNRTQGLRPGLSTCAPSGLEDKQNISLFSPIALYFFVVYRGVTCTAIA